VSHRVNVDPALRVGNLVDDPIVAYPNTPEMGGTLDLSTTLGARIVRQRLDSGESSEGYSSREVLQLLSR
jgi:hypothetical protein